MAETYSLDLRKTFFHFSKVIKRETAKMFDIGEDAVA